MGNLLNNSLPLTITFSHKQIIRWHNIDIEVIYLLHKNGILSGGKV